jgi:amino acid adenylation domain-containing protein
MTQEANVVSIALNQQRLWFLDQLSPGSAAYNIHAAYALSGPLHPKALEQAFNEVVRRHDALRTTFVHVDAEAMQVIAPTLKLEMPIIELQGISEEERQTEARCLATEEARRPFDLAQGPLARMKLLRLAGQEHVLLVTMHHIISDGWSLQVFARELSTLYDAFAIGGVSPLPPLPIQYADFAVRQRQRLRGQLLERQLAFWRQQLQGAPPVLPLPTDYPRPPVQSFEGAQQALLLSATLTNALRTLSRQQGVTLFMVLLAALQTLLSRLTGQDDIVVGTPVAGRNRTDVEALIGFFVNTLVLRTDLSGNPSFQELLQRVRTFAIEAFGQQELPFERLVEELRLERDLSRNPLFDVLLNYSDQPWASLRLRGLRVRPVELSDRIARFAMTLYATRREDQLELQLVYQRALFGAERMKCLLDELHFVLEQIVEAPQRSIQLYSLVTPERRVMLPDPSIALDEPRQTLVTDVFMAWAERTPQQPAISQGQQTWTYSALAARTEHLARTLVAMGVRCGDAVAVVGSPSFGLIASVLAVLRSGGVVLTIDCDLPSQRKQLMLQEAGARYIIVVGNLRPEELGLELEGALGLHVLTVPATQGHPISREAARDHESVDLPQVTPEDAAYIFFTSGSTGVPKGVLGCHKGLSHCLAWQRETFAISPQDRVSQLISLSFDPVLRDIFLPLTSGATICMPEDKNSLGPEDLWHWLVQERISVLHTVPSLAEFWGSHVPEGMSLPSLRWLFFTGEPLREHLVRRWRSLLPRGAGIVNLYGPTETTLVKCFYRIPKEISSGVQPVGRPLPHTQALVLSENGQLCGIAEPGEIVLRTPFRTRGYINASEEQRWRFIKNPWCDDPQDWLYRTGDRGRYRPDGLLEILGRLDDQVKIRGVRVEPDGVAAILARHPAVQACCVVARQDSSGQTSLVAYVVAAPQDALTIPQVKSFLSLHLPPVMVPGHAVLLDYLPRLPNGKVDRQALASLSQVRSEPKAAFVSPSTPVEKMLATIWADILGLAQVGIHDSFFELGGHSLLATRVISRVRTTFQVALPLRRFFEDPTVAGLAVAVTEHQAESVKSDTLDSLLAALEGYSDEEAQRLLDEET